VLLWDGKLSKQELTADQTKPDLIMKSHVCAAPLAATYIKQLADESNHRLTKIFCLL